MCIIDEMFAALDEDNILKYGFAFSGKNA